MALKYRNSTSHTGDPVLFYDLLGKLWGWMGWLEISLNECQGSKKHIKRQFFSVRLLETY